MESSIAQFVVRKLNEPGVVLSRVSEATGIPARTLQHLKAGHADNAWASRVEVLARHFGFRFEPVPVESSDSARTFRWPPAGGPESEGDA